MFELAPGFAILLEVGNQTHFSCPPLVVASEVPCRIHPCVFVTHLLTVQTQLVGSRRDLALVLCGAMRLTVS